MSGVIELAAVAALAAAGTAAARAYALRRRLVDEPGARRSHSVATPRGGGAGPVVAVLAWLMVREPVGAQTWPLVAALAAVALIGAWDDHSPLPAAWRLVVHLLAGIAVASAIVLPTAQPVAFVAIVLAVAVLVNVWNFMDGINGIATSQAVILCLAVAALSEAARDAALVVAVAWLAFLPFNFPRARIFLGDVGSGALGLALAWLVATAAVHAPQPADALPLALPASAFLVDATMTLARRVVRGERWWEPHTQHLYQGLARRYGHVPVTSAYAAWSAVMALATMLVRGLGPAFTVGSVVLCYMGAALLWLVLQRQLAMECGASGTRDP